MTNQIVKPTLVVYKTIRAGDEFSAAIGSVHNRILTFAYVTENLPVSANFNVNAKLGYAVVKGGENPREFRTRKTISVVYDAPKDASLRGRSDHINIDVEYEGEVITHRVSVLLV